MIAMTTEEIRNACGGRLTGDGTAVITDITTDSRKAASGSLFAAIAGEHTDGHRYMEKAQELGAAAVLCERQPEKLPL